MYDHLFEQQQSFGIKPWREYAADASVPDGVVFEACIQNTESLPRVEQGRELGQEVGVHGTPTLIINGWKLARPPGAEELGRMVQAKLMGTSPVSADQEAVRSR